MRMVPGLGTRAVDRLADDYPVLVAPGQPGLRVNVTPDEVLRYSPEEGRRDQPRDRDVRDRRARGPAARARRRLPPDPQARLDGRARTTSAPADGARLDFENDDLVVTFEGLISRHPVRGPDAHAAPAAAGAAWERRWTSSSPRTARTSTCCSAAPQGALGATPRRHRSPRRPARAGPLHRPPLRLERPRARHHPRRLRRPRRATPRSPTWPSMRAGRAGGRPAQRACCRSGSSSSWGPGAGAAAATSSSA